MRNRKGFTKAEMQTKITNHVIDGLERGVAPWIREWSDDGTSNPLVLSPRNGKSQRPYSGVNWLILGMLSPYKSNEWFTKNQIIDMMEVDEPIPYEEYKKGTQIIFYTDWDFKDRDGVDQTRPVMRVYTVWNREQIPGLPETVRTTKFDPKSTIDEMLNNLNLKGGVNQGGDKACYVPSQDAVMIPNDEAFDTPEAAVSVKAHEGCHATGAEHRLNRKLEQDTKAYAYEELIAELGSAMVCASLGIPLDKLRHTDYIGAWLERLKNDKTYVFSAAADASKAMKYLMKEVA